MSLLLYLTGVVKRELVRLIAIVQCHFVLF